MSAEEICVAILKGDATVAAATDSGSRIWLERVPQDFSDWPGVLINFINVRPDKCQQGDGVDAVMLMVSVIDTTYSGVVTLLDAVRNAIDNKTTGDYSGTTLIGITLETGGAEPEADKGTLFSKSLDFQFLIQK